MATKRIFIDGQAGTTGLGIHERLQTINSVELVQIPAGDRKNARVKQELLETVDLTILCLPDDAARETVGLCDQLPGGGPVIVDASTAHRVANGWDYGFAEMDRAQRDVIRNSRRITNPGCYPTGAIALIRPLVKAGFFPPEFPLSINAVSGYTGGGRKMIEGYQAGTAPVFELYGLTLAHKHLPEIQKYGRLGLAPTFVPSVGNFPQGMLVSIPVPLASLIPRPSIDEIHKTLVDHYSESQSSHNADPLVRVQPLTHPACETGKLSADTLADSDHLELFVFTNPSQDQCVLVARLDNLGKGASGAAVQNMKLALGLV